MAATQTPPWISRTGLVLVFLSFMLGFVFWFTPWDIAIFVYFTEEHQGHWQHIYGILSMLGQAWFQQVMCIAIAAALTIRLGAKVYRKYSILLIPIFYLGSFTLFIEMLFGKKWTRPLGSVGRGIDWLKAKLDGAPAEARLWAYSTPLYLMIGILVHIPKIIVGRTRPRLYEWHGTYTADWFEVASRWKAWPSGHAITTFALIAIIWPHYPRWRWLMVLIGAIVVMGRVGGGAHWMGDILPACGLGYLVGRYYAQRYGLDKLKIRKA